VVNYNRQHTAHNKSINAQHNTPHISTHTTQQQCANVRNVKHTRRTHDFLPLSVLSTIVVRLRHARQNSKCDATTRRQMAKLAKKLRDDRSARVKQSNKWCRCLHHLCNGIGLWANAPANANASRSSQNQIQLQWAIANELDHPDCCSTMSR